MIAECRHDMQPSVQLLSVSGVDSKLGIARPSLQSAPESSALDLLPISKCVPDVWQFLEVFDIQ